MASKAASKVKKVQLADLDLTQVKHHPLKVKKYDNGQESKSCAVTYQDGNKIIFQLPKSKVPFGLTVGKMDDNDKKLVEEGKKWPKYSLEVNIDGDEREKVLDFDDLNSAFIAEHVAKEYWKKNLTPDQVIEHDYYGSMVKANNPEKGDFPDRFKVKLPFSRGKPLFKVYDSNNQKINLFSVVDGKPVMDWSWTQQQMQAEIISEIECIWEVNKKCYCTCRALQIRVHPPDALPECDFDDDGDGVTGDDEAEESDEVAEVTEQVAKLEVEVEVEDEVEVEVEDEVEDEVEIEAEDEDEDLAVEED